jgi:hypothetical protein
MEKEFKHVSENFFEGYLPLKKAISVNPLVHKKVMESLDKIKAKGGKLIQAREAMTGSDLLANLIVIQHELDNELPYIVDDPLLDITQVTQEKTVSNFNEIKLYQTTEVEDLLEVKPTEDYKGTYFSDSYDSLAIKKYGRIFGVAWETMLNDILGELSQLPNKFRRAATRTLFKQITDTFAENTDFYAAACGNTGTPVLNQEGLQAGLTAMMSQEDANGNKLNIKAVYLMVPTALSFVAEQLVNPILQSIAAATMVAAPVRFSLKVIVNPWLDDYSTTGWYLFADPSVLPAITRLTLAGHKGIEMFIRVSDQKAIANAVAGELGSFSNDILDFKVRMFHNSTTRYCQASYYSDGTVDLATPEL